MNAECNGDVQQIRDGAEAFERARRLVTSAVEYFKADLPIVGIGHSIGAVTLLALAGGEAQTLDGDTVMSGSKLKFDRLALFAPPTDFSGDLARLDR